MGKDSMVNVLALREELLGILAETDALLARRPHLTVADVATAVRIQERTASLSYDLAIAVSAIAALRENSEVTQRLLESMLLVFGVTPRGLVDDWTDDINLDVCTSRPWREDTDAHTTEKIDVPF